MAYKKSQNIFTNKTLIAQVVLVVAVGVSVFVFEKFSSKFPGLTISGSKEATLFIDFDNMKRRFQGEVADGMTVLDAVNASVAAGEIKITYSVDGDNNTKVMEINNHSTEEVKQFSFYINSKRLGQSDLNKTYIKPGDEIIVRLE